MISCYFLVAWGSFSPIGTYPFWPPLFTFSGRCITLFIQHTTLTDQLVWTLWAVSTLIPLAETQTY